MFVAVCDFISVQVLMTQHGILQSAQNQLSDIDDCAQDTLAQIRDFCL